MRQLDFFIVGAPKCGTTAIHSYLSRHPQVFLPTHKEPHFFGSDLDFQDQQRPDPEEYAALFAEASPDQRIGEGSVFYLVSHTAAREIREHSPNARIIVILRNPVDAMYSFHSQRLYNGTEDVTDFARALELESDRKRGRNLPANIGLRQGLFYRELVDFPTQVERYIEAFGRDRVLVLLYDDLRADPASLYREMCRFIEVDPTFEISFEVVNPNKRARFAWIRNQLWKPAPWARRVARAVLPNPAQRRALGSRLRSWNAIAEPRIPLDPELRGHLLQELRPSLDALAGLIGRDLASWTQTRGPLGADGG